MVAPARKAGEESPSSTGQSAGEMPGGVIRGKWHRNYTADGPRWGTGKGEMVG